MFVDFILNKQGHGPVGEQLAGCRFDPGLMRPYLDQYGRQCVTVNTGRLRYNREENTYEPIYQQALVSELLNSGIPIPVSNATTLRKNEWIELDKVVLDAARERLRAWSDLAGANTFSLNGMTKTILEHETVSDPGEANVDMDGVTPGRTDRPKYQLEGLPLPITHSDFFFSSRQISASRASGTPLDSAMASFAGRRVAETVEKTLIGTITGLTYGTASNYGRTPSVYGYTNFSARNTKTNVTTPTGTNPEATVSDILAMRQTLYGDKFYGPYMVYHSTDWDLYMDNDYARLGGNNANMTLRDRLRAIDGIQDVRRLDFLTNTFTLIMVQMTADVARAVVGMDMTTVQWETVGGMQLNFKVMAIMVPQLRADFNGNCGIIHGTTS